MNLPQVFTAKARHLGVNITTNSVSLVQLSSDLKVSLTDSVTSESSFFQGDNVNTKALTDALINLLAKVKPLQREAAICFPERLAYSREHILPKLDFHEIDEAISWQLASIFPLDSNDIYTDWKLLAQTETETKVIVIAVNRKVLDGLHQACVDSGLKPMSFEPSASVLARAIPDNIEPHVILEVDNLGTSASLIEQGISTLTTTTSFAGSTDLNLIIQNINASIVNLLSRRLDPNGSTSPAQLTIYLTGEKSSPKLKELLSGVSQLKIDHLPLPVSSPVFHLPYVAAQSSLLPPQSEKTINLLPVNLQQQYRCQNNIDEAKFFTKIGAAFGLIAVIFSAAVLVISSVLSTSINNQILKTQIPSPVDTKINLPQITQKSTQITVLQSKKYMPVEAIDTINQEQILSGHIKKLTYDASKKQIVLIISQSERETLYTVKANLEKTGKFSNLIVPLSAFSTEGAEDSTLTLTLK